MKKGYTLIELLIAIAVLTVILVISAATFYNLTKKSDIDISRDNIISTLNTARNKTVASEGSAQYGVYFDITSSPDRYILRSTSFEEIHDLLSTIEISIGGGSEVVFKRLDGSTDNYGSITIKHLTTNETRTIYIYSSGEISTKPGSTSEAGRITDSRHVHFDLGTWSIQNATTLKFYFSSIFQTEIVDMANYFVDTTEFDWEGEFTVNEATQKFRVHTHQLNPTTLLCIHRDRNKGKNTEEVYIYIIQDTIEKEIAHYLADADDIVYRGSDVSGNMTPQ